MRRPAARGLAYNQANPQLIAVENDVLGIKDEIESRWSELKLYYDEIDEVWVVVQHCLDGVDRLVFDTPVLDRQVIERCERADQTRAGGGDWEEEVDRANAEIEKEAEHQFSEKVGDASERLIHAFRKDGLIAPQIFIKEPIPNGKSS